jgi:2,3-bisphosphoglycerate-independent phosphoglycerate mutase
MTRFVPKRRPVVLCVLDGWGHRPEPTDDNAILKARTPNFDRLAERCPVAFLDASESHVGLPSGQMGNSEVGHMNLGAGRVVMQDLPRIDSEVASGRLAQNKQLLDFAANLKKSGGAAHLMGLLSPGGVHSHQDHMVAVAKALAAQGLTVWIHCFLDGRDTPPKSADAYLRKFIADIGGAARIGTVSGRFYSMDRDKRWERVELAYKTMVEAQGETAPEALAALKQSYDAGKADEFVLPTAIAGYPGMRDGDGVVMANFRADRAREILLALLDPGFKGFARARVVRFAAALGMTEYSDELNRFLATMYPPQSLSHMMGEIVAGAGLKQLRIAETEKYAHVTFFFNGGAEQPLPGEQRILIPSPKVATYDLKPEMSAYEVTDRLVEAIQSGEFDFIVVNYANTDMVGHTGDFAAAKKAVEVVDACVGRLAAAVEAAGGALLITADHGNAEMMMDHATGQAHTAHTINRVPVMVVGGAEPGRNAPFSLHDGRLSDVAPTLLELLGLPQPVEMTGRTLIASPPDSGRVRAAD